MSTPALPNERALARSSLAAIADPGFEVHRFLAGALSRLRWITLLALLLITLVMPSNTPLGMANWVLVLLFAAYSSLVVLFRKHVPAALSISRLAILDLLVVALLYLLAAEPGGPLFILFFLAVDYAAASLGLRGILLYTAAIAFIASTIDLTFLMWTPTMLDVRLMLARVVMLGIVGVGMTIVIRRLVLEHQVTQSARDETSKTEELEQVRARFIASISHELRTPLTAARASIGIIEMSMAGRMGSDEQEMLSSARRNTERLSILIDDLLTFNRFEAHTVRLNREQLDLRMVVMDCLSAVYPLILQKEQTLEVALTEPLHYTGDPKQLGQVIVNLLANAQRHTGAGTAITISGRSTPDEVLLSVSDNGGGIAADELENILGNLNRPHRGDQGSGLGLGIAKAIVELHGGRMWASSVLGKGSSFNIAFPHIAAGGVQP